MDVYKCLQNGMEKSEVIIICNNFCSPFSGSLNPRESNQKKVPLHLLTLLLVSNYLLLYKNLLLIALEGKSVPFEASEKLKV